MPTLGFVLGPRRPHAAAPLTLDGDRALTELARLRAPWLIFVTSVGNLLSSRFPTGARSRGPRRPARPARSGSSRPSAEPPVGRVVRCSLRCALDPPSYS